MSLKEKILACLSVGLWLGNTVLHLKMPMDSGLYKSRYYMLQYNSDALWAMEDSVFRSSPVLTQCVLLSFGIMASELASISCCLEEGYSFLLAPKSIKEPKVCQVRWVFS